MESFKYETQGTNTYIVYKLDDTEMLDSMTLGMITNNKIPGLAQAFFFQQDSVKYVKYNISSKVSAEQFLMGTVNKKRLIGVFKGIVNAMISAEEYMIDISSLCLDMEYIFTDVSTCETVVICLPVIDMDKEITDLKAFFKNIVFSTQFDQSENGDYIAKLINYLNSASVFSLYDFKDVLDEIEYGMKNAVTQEVQVVSHQIQETPVEVIQQPQMSVPIQNIPVQSVPQQLQTPPIEKVIAPVQTVPQPQVEKNIPKMEIPKKIEQPSTNMGFAIPTKASTTSSNTKEDVSSSVPTDGKEISWLYLMQHYNKENAAIYKAQQEAKKAAKANGSSAKKEKKEKKGKDTASVPTPMNQAFAIPGQSVEPPKPMSTAPSSVPTAPPATPVMPQPTAVPQGGQMSSVPQGVPTVPQSTPVMPQPTPVAPQSVPVQSVPISQPMGMPANFGETTVLSAGVGETTVLNVAPVAQDMKPYLIRSKNNEKILLDKPVFRIGKEKSYVDYFIGDNTAISRSHANIIIRDGEYFVVDTNSTNHTYVNGGMLQSNVETKISHGTKIRLANEDFEFKLY